jgi:hypothetical protein
MGEVTMKIENIIESADKHSKPCILTVFSLICSLAMQKYYYKLDNTFMGSLKHYFTSEVDTFSAHAHI